MNGDSNVPGCFKYGCMGCLSLGAVFVALIFLVGAIQFTVEPGEPQPEERRTEQELPTPPEPPSPRLPATDAPAIPETLSVTGQESVAGGRIELDVSMVDIIIQPGPADEPIRVEADYDSGAFELNEAFSEADDGTWTYSLDFGSRRGFLGMILGGGHQGNNRVVLTIPRDHPVDLIGEIGVGESEIDLGGLWVREVDLELGTGEHFIEFREPVPVPMASFQIEASVGEVEVRDLGEGSPAVVDVEHSIGELFVDLQGSWRQDAVVDIEFGIGESRLWLPEGVHLDIERAKVGIGESNVDWPDQEGLPDDAPTLTVSMEGNIGDVRIEH